MATFDIGPFFGSHADVLRAEVDKLAPGSLVIEHGVGVYSSPVIATRDVRVLAVEAEPGWASWAAWFYGVHGRSFSVVERAKNTIAQLPDASLVFIDGAARDRGPMLGWALERLVPTIVAHDTEEDALDQYLYTRTHLRAAGYRIEHHGVTPRTTVWSLIP